MSFDGRLKAGEMRLIVGEVYSNDLQGVYEEHRRIDRIEGDHLFFKVVSGRRCGWDGDCKVASLWVWARTRVTVEGK